MISQVPDEVAALPATCELIYVYLYMHEEPMRVSDIDQISGRPANMIRRSLFTLWNETDAVTRRTYQKDGREYVYEICRD